MKKISRFLKGGNLDKSHLQLFKSIWQHPLNQGFSYVGHESADSGKYVYVSDDIHDISNGKIEITITHPTTKKDDALAKKIIPMLEKKYAGFKFKNPRHINSTMNTHEEIMEMMYFYDISFEGEKPTFENGKAEVGQVWSVKPTLARRISPSSIHFIHIREVLKHALPIGYRGSFLDKKYNLVNAYGYVDEANLLEKDKTDGYFLKQKKEKDQAESERASQEKSYKNTFSDVDSFMEKQNTWFLRYTQHSMALDYGTLTYRSREHGDIAYETPGKEDIAEAQRLKRLLSQKFPQFKITIDTVGEYTELDITTHK